MKSHYKTSNGHQRALVPEEEEDIGRAAVQSVWPVLRLNYGTRREFESCSTRHNVTGATKRSLFDHSLFTSHVNAVIDRPTDRKAPNLYFAQRDARSGDEYICLLAMST